MLSATLRVRWEHRETSPRRQRSGHVRQLRAVPAALPDVPRDRRRGVVAARPDLGDARRPLRRRRGHRRLRALHGDVRAVPRLRAGVPQRRAVRPADGGHPRHAGCAAAHDAVVAAARVPRARPPSAAAGRLDVARRRPTVATGAEADGAAEAGAAPRPAPDADRRRRVAVHRLRHGCMAARDAPQHRQGARRRVGVTYRHPGCWRRRAAARCTSTPG